MNSSDFVLSGGRLVLPDRVLSDASLVIEKGSIVAILEKGATLPAALPRIDAGGAWVTPGFVELHIHGCGGVGFDDLGPDPKAGAASILRARAFLRARGVTCFVPTLVCREEQIAALAAALDEAGVSETELPGIYVEGPFISEVRRGGIPADTIRDPDIAAAEALIELARGRLKLMTVAPELPGARELMSRLEAAGVLVCLGHSDCDLTAASLPEGRFSVTHLFNAMSPFSHKEAGLAMLPFVDRRPFFELNADGVHVGEVALRACAGGTDPDRLMLISDAVVAAGLPHGDYSYYGMKIVSAEKGVRYADSGILMGSNRLAPEVLLNWLRVTGSSVPSAVRALTLTPARALGLDDRRGAIAPGLMADLVVWKGDFESPSLLLG